MEVTMLAARTWQHAGRERLLDIGAVVTVPEAIGVALIASGAARRHVPAEQKPLRVAETGDRRRRA